MDVTYSGSAQCQSEEFLWKLLLLEDDILLLIITFSIKKLFLNNYTEKSIMFTSSFVCLPRKSFFKI